MTGFFLDCDLTTIDNLISIWLIWKKNILRVKISLILLIFLAQCTRDFVLTSDSKSKL